MKVTETTATDNQTTTKINLELDGLSKDDAEQVKTEIGQYLVEQVLLSVGEAKSPVSGESWPGLSKTYKAKKVADGSAPIANMELTGDMLNALEARPTEDGVEIGFFDKSQAPKADGHLKFSGLENNTPQRRFLPGEGQNFKKDIDVEVSRMIADVQSENVKPEDFKGVESSADLYTVLEEIFPDLSKNEIRLAAARNSSLMDILEELDLVEFL